MLGVVPLRAAGAAATFCWKYPRFEQYFPTPRAQIWVVRYVYVGSLFFHSWYLGTWQIHHGHQTPRAFVNWVLDNTEVGADFCKKTCEKTKLFQNIHMLFNKNQSIHKNTLFAVHYGLDMWLQRSTCFGLATEVSRSNSTRFFSTGLFEE